MRFVRLLLAVLALAGAGCATVPYRYVENLEKPNIYRLPAGEPQVEWGRPNKFLDTFGWVVGIPSKILLLNLRVDNHRVEPAIEAALAGYLQRNGLENTKVRVNQYRPGAEWRRLFRNKAVAPGWRYSLGVVSVASYTVFAGRVFGGDNYNPYTNTISLYSDLVSTAIHEGGHAKDFAGKEMKGTYAAVYSLPFAPLYYEAKATNDALGYLRAERSVTEQKQGYKVLYPAYGTYIGGSIGDWLPPPYNYAVELAVLVPCHVAGRIQAACIDEPPPAAPLPPPAPTGGDPALTKP
jgi:hypothetical protein